MKRNLRVCSLVGIAAVTLMSPDLAAADGPTVTSFSVVVTASHAGLGLRCLKGCDWTTLDHACRPDAPCWAQVDQSGLVGEGTPVPPTTQPGHFRFLITVGGAGFSAQCKAGCAWKSLSYRCGASGSCTATVDEDGVRGPDLPAE